MFNENSIPRGPFRTELRRREWLKVAGGMMLAPSLLGAAAEDWKAKAKQNLRLAVTSNTFAGLALEQAAAKIKELGFGGVLTDFAFADVRFDPLQPDWQALKSIRAAFDRHGIGIVGLMGYTNIVDPDAERRKRGDAKLEFLIANWKRLGCPQVSTETGTLNTKSEWLESPENATEAAYQQCRAALERLARQAEQTGAILSIEAYWRNVIGSIDRAERLFRDVKSPALKLVMDPCNYFRKEDLPNMQAMLEDMFKRLGSQVAIAHAKDVKAAPDGTDLPAAGLGVLDYPLYLRLLAQLDRPLDLVVEHVTAADVPRARDYVLAQMEKV